MMTEDRDDGRPQIGNSLMATAGSIGKLTPSGGGFIIFLIVQT